MAWSRDPRTPTRYMRGSKRYNDVGGHSPPGDELENTRDHERIWFELKRSRSCCDCTSPGFKYCFETFDWPGYICDGEFPGGDTLLGYWPGTVSNDSSWKVDQGCAGSELRAADLNTPTNHTSGSWRNGPYYDSNGWSVQWNSTGVHWGNFFPNFDRTLEAWIKPTASDISNGRPLIQHGLVGDPSGGLDVYFRSDGAVGLSHVEIGGGDIQESGPGWWEADQWHHFVLVRSTVSQTIAVFINGRLALSRLLPTTGWSVGSFPSVPSIVSGYGAWADIAYYTSALSPAVIRKHYQSIYGVEGVANPLSSTEGNIEDPTTVITEPIPVDVIDGGGEGQVGYIVVSQGDYSAYVSPEDSPFELEERKGQADGYAALDSTALVPTDQLGTGSVSDEQFLRGDRTWETGDLLPLPAQLYDCVQVRRATQDAYEAKLEELFSGNLRYWPLTESSTPYADIGTHPETFGDFSGSGSTPPRDDARNACFFNNEYLRFGPSDALLGSDTVEAFPIGIALWLRLDALPASTSDVFRISDGVASRNKGLRVLTDGRLEIFGASDATVLTTTETLVVGEWNLIVWGTVASFSSQSRLFLNGVDVGVASSVSSDGALSMLVGGDGLEFSLGHIALFFVGINAVTEAQALELYEARSYEWQAVPEFTGGGVDASEDDTPVTAAPRSRFNFKTGANISLTVTDDPGDDEVEVTIAATSPAGAGIEVSDNDADVSASPRGRINFLDGTGTTVVTADDGANDEVEVRIDVDNPLPDPSGEADGDVLTIASGTWAVATPAGGGGGTGTALAIEVAQTAHGFSVGDVLRRDSGAYAPAQADSSANAEVDGIVSAVADANNFTLTLSGEVTGLSGLTDGETYFLSESAAGSLTATEPSATGEVSKPLLRATGTTTGLFTNWRGAIVQ